MNNKTLLGLAAIIAMTIMVVAGFYFNSKSNGQADTVATTAKASVPQGEEAVTSTIQGGDKVTNTDKADLQEKVVAPEKKSRTPALLSFEFDLNQDSTGTIEYQNYIFEKTAKDTGKSVNDFSLQERGAMETEDPSHSVYVYKFHTGSDCEVHMVDIDANTGDYQVSYNYC